MLPALLLLGIGRRPRLWIPLPILLLLWPVWILGWFAWLVLRVAQTPQAAPLRTGLTAVAHLSGVRVDVDTKDGDNIHVRLI